jgi:hypothetical protein
MFLQSSCIKGLDPCWWCYWEVVETLGSSRWWKKLGHWGRVFERDIGTLASSSLSLCFLASMKWADLLCHWGRLVIGKEKNCHRTLWCHETLLSAFCAKLLDSVQSILCSCKFLLNCRILFNCKSFAVVSFDKYRKPCGNSTLDYLSVKALCLKHKYWSYLIHSIKISES